MGDIDRSRANALAQQINVLVAGEAAMDVIAALETMLGLTIIQAATDPSDAAQIAEVGRRSVLQIIATRWRQVRETTTQVGEGGRA